MKLVLIGGGEIGKGSTSYETLKIDEEIVRMSGKTNPKLLFIGLASNFSDSYYDLIKNIYKNLGCECSYLKKKNILNNPDIVKNKILSADIIYIGGGDTIKLMSEVLEYGIDKLLKQALDNNCVLAGISAGAILLAKSGLSDSLILRGEGNSYSFIDGLGFCEYVISPHYHNDLRRKDALNNLINSNLKVLCLDNCSALMIDDNNIKVIKCNENSRVCFSYLNCGLVVEEDLG